MRGITAGLLAAGLAAALAAAPAAAGGRVHFGFGLHHGFGHHGFRHHGFGPFYGYPYHYRPYRYGHYGHAPHRYRLRERYDGEAARRAERPEAQGEPCREFTTTAVIDGEEQELHGTVCRQPDGSWRLVQ